jgi:hypothetical protein
MSQVKFKIGFTIASDTLIAMIAKFLPVEDVSVTEIVPKLKAPTLHLPRAEKKTNKRASPGPNLKKGINGIIMAEFSTGPKRALDLQPKVVAAGFSANSVNSRLEELRKVGVIERMGDGKWKQVG